MPDRPESYRALPEPVRDFLSTLPTAWDDIKLLAGYPGESVVLARLKNDTWYVAGINGTDEPMTLSFQIDELTGEKESITFFKDGAEERSFTIEEKSDLSDFPSTIEVDCLPRGGFVVVIN